MRALGSDTAVFQHQNLVGVEDAVDALGLVANSDLDLVIAEGYKKALKPKIEVVRAARHSQALLLEDPHLVAVVSDVGFDLDVPVFGLEEIDPLAAFIEERYLKQG